ncbi:MAG: hypothetical protein BWY65_02247 [Firmicutes bacterium ADurb.Bin373]|nr:MAG: hypothetical protein BWY65_02247 [Firmicutes bacterium ADurb.Bin373]
MIAETVSPIAKRVSIDTQGVKYFMLSLLKIAGKTCSLAEAYIKRETLISPALNVVMVAARLTAIIQAAPVLPMAARANNIWGAGEAARTSLGTSAVMATVKTAYITLRIPIEIIIPLDISLIWVTSSARGVTHSNPTKRNTPNATALIIPVAPPGVYGALS